MSRLVDIFNHLGRWRIVIPRYIDSRKELSLKKGNYPYERPTKEQKQELKTLWGKHKPNLKYVSLYNYKQDKFDARYIPDDIYYTKIDPYFNDGISCSSLDDKNFYNLYFPDIKQPKTIARKNGNIYLDERYDIIDIETVVRLCITQQRVVIKKSTLSDGGKNIVFWSVSDGEEKLRSALSAVDNFVVQEIVAQHNSIGKIHPSSLNSIRILTLTLENEVKVLSTIVRMGANGSNVDNGHSGGIFCGVDNDGRFKNVAYTYMDGQRFDDVHPTTHIKFTDCRIPNYPKCLELVKKLAPRLCRVSRLTSWDLTVDENENPVLIEVNLAYGGLFFHQIANGPVFGELTNRVLKEVFKK